MCSATSLPPSSLLISERQLAIREDQMVTSIFILRRVRQASKHCEYLVVASWWSRWRAKQRRICVPGRQLMKAWKFYKTAAPGGWFTFRLNSEQGRSSIVPSRFRRREWQQNSWQVVLMMLSSTSTALTTPCVLERRKMRKRKRLKSNYLQALMLREQETARNTYRMIVATQSNMPLCLGQRSQKVSLAEWKVSPSDVSSSRKLNRKSAPTYAHEISTMRHSLCSRATAHLGSSLFWGCRKQMLTLTVFSANITRGRSRSDEQASAMNFSCECPQILHCPHVPSTEQYSNWQYPLPCSISRARTLSMLIIRNVPSAKRVQTGESCFMGKRRALRRMLAKTKPDRHIWATRQTAYGHPESYSHCRKESNPILIIIYRHPPPIIGRVGMVFMSQYMMGVLL